MDGCFQLNYGQPPNFQVQEDSARSHHLLHQIGKVRNIKVEIKILELVKALVSEKIESHLGR
jgi:hypothetical protein